MSILIRMELMNKRVLIIGGGNVALRKAKEYIKQQAKVTVLAKQHVCGFYDLNVILISEPYQQKYLENMELVYAATDDENINAQIVQDAKDQGIPGLCAHADISDLQSVISYETKDIQIGVSTKGSYPSLNRILLERFQSLYETEYQSKMPLLKTLRGLILNSQLEQGMAYALLKNLADQPAWFLIFLKQALTCRKVCILAFHGVKFAENIEQEILPFLNDLHEEETAFGFAYLSGPVIEILHQKQVIVWSLEKLLSLLDVCGISTRVYPMLMQDGRFYDQIKAACSLYHAQALSLPFQNQAQVQELMDLIHAAYGEENKTLVILYHSSPSGKFASYVKALALPSNTLIIQEKALDRIEDTSQHMIVYSLYMLNGYHMQTDGIEFQKLRKQKDIELIQQSCVASGIIKNMLMKRIQASLKEQPERLDSIG